MVLPKSFSAHTCRGSRTPSCYRRSFGMNRDSALGRSHDDEAVEGRTGEIRCEALCSRATDAEENSIRECDIDWKFVRAEDSPLEA